MFKYDSLPEKENKISTSMEYALLGQKIDDYEMKFDSYERLSHLIGQSKLAKFKSFFELFLAPWRLKKVKLNQFQSKVDSHSTSYQMLHEIMYNPDYVWDVSILMINKILIVTNTRFINLIVFTNYNLIVFFLKIKGFSSSS